MERIQQLIVTIKVTIPGIEDLPAQELGGWVWSNTPGISKDQIKTRIEGYYLDPDTADSEAEHDATFILNEANRLKREERNSALQLVTLLAPASPDPSEPQVVEGGQPTLHGAPSPNAADEVARTVVDDGSPTVVDPQPPEGEGDDNGEGNDTERTAVDAPTVDDRSAANLEDTVLDGEQRSDELEPPERFSRATVIAGRVVGIALLVGLGAWLLISHFGGDDSAKSGDPAFRLAGETAVEDGPTAVPPTAGVTNEELASEGAAAAAVLKKHDGRLDKLEGRVVAVERGVDEAKAKSSEALTAARIGGGSSCQYAKLAECETATIGGVRARFSGLLSESEIEVSARRGCERACPHLAAGVASR